MDPQLPFTLPKTMWLMKRTHHELVSPLSITSYLAPYATLFIDFILNLSSPWAIASSHGVGLGWIPARQ
jgi:hypothetical protein